MQARFFSALEEATCLLDLSTEEMTELIVDTIWALAIAGYLHPHTCRAILNRAMAAGMSPTGPYMNHANSFKLVQARPPYQVPGALEAAACVLHCMFRCDTSLCRHALCSRMHGTGRLHCVCAAASHAPGRTGAGAERAL